MNKSKCDACRTVGEIRNPHRVLERKHGNILGLLETLSCKSQDIIKVNITKIGCEDVNWIELGQNSLC